jgi:hypothetical protein
MAEETIQHNAFCERGKRGPTVVHQGFGQKVHLNGLVVLEVRLWCWKTRADLREELDFYFTTGL